MARRDSEKIGKAARDAQVVAGLVNADIQCRRPGIGGSELSDAATDQHVGLSNLYELLSRGTAEDRVNTAFDIIVGLVGSIPPEAQDSVLGNVLAELLGEALAPEKV